MKRSLSVFLILGVLFVFFWYLFNTSTESQIDSDINHWIDEGLVVNSLNENLEKVMTVHLLNTPYHGRFNINGPVLKNHINLYLVRNEALSVSYPSLACNCAFMVGSEIIICDADFLIDFKNYLHSGDEEFDSLDNEFGEGSGESSGESISTLLNASFSDFILHWVIGHEIGHIMLNHLPLGNQIVHSDTVWGNEIEREADIYMASKFSNDQQQQFWAWMTLSQFATRLYSTRAFESLDSAKIEEFKSKGIDPIFGTKVKVEVETNPNRHAPWIIRVVEMANHMIEVYPHLYDNTGYFDRIKTNLQPILSNNPRDWFCQNRESAILLDHSFDFDLSYFKKLIQIGPQSDVIESYYLSILERYKNNNRKSLLKLIFSEYLIYNGEYEQSKALNDSIYKFNKPLIEKDLQSYLQYLLNKSLHGKMTNQPIFDDPETEEQFNSIELLAQEYFQNDIVQYNLSDYYFDMWKLTAALTSIDNPWPQHFQNSLFGSDIDMVMVDKIYSFWLAEIKKIENAESRLDQSIGLFEFLANTGRNADAVKIGKLCVLEMDNLDLDHNGIEATVNLFIGKLLNRLQKPELSSNYFNRVVEIRDSEIASIPPSDTLSLILSKRQLQIALNDIGYSNILALEFGNALPFLKRALNLASELGDTTEIATVLQNLSQAQMGIRANEESTNNAFQAWKIRSNSKLNDELILNSKSLYAANLYGIGEKDSARVLLKEWIEEYRLLADFNFLSNDLIMIINSNEVLVREMLGEPDSTYSKSQDIKNFLTLGDVNNVIENIISE